MDVAVWLRGLGLHQYDQAFHTNDISADMLPTLTAADLREMGVLSLGHRKRLLEAAKALAGKMQQAASEPAATLPSWGERRHLTVLFCDLVGSTQLAGQLDPEDFGSVIRRYQDACAQVVACHGGRLFEFLGDGVLVYFGHPRAHEDDAERAVRAGLDLADAVGQLTLADGTALRARIGIATGLVVVGASAGVGEERVALGETPSLASRLQMVAEPGAVVIDAATQRLVGRLFECSDLGRVAVKGFAGPVQAARVLRRRAINSRSEALHTCAASAPIIGRDQETGLLLHRWAQAQQGEGRVVLLSGEAGIGKSRIASGLVARLAEEDHGCLQYFCSPYHQDSALFPVIRQLEQASGFARTDQAESRHAKLGALLAPTTERQDEIALIADLLELPGRDPLPLPDLGPQRRKERLLEALLAQLASVATCKPILVLFEDVHWIDPTSLELLELAVERIRRLPVLLVVTFRPEFRPPWAGMSHVTALTLGGLARAEAAELVEQTAGAGALPNATVAEIVERTDGVPLFVEELTRAIAEANPDEVAAKNAPAASRAVPAALHAPLMSRFDRLGPAKEIAQVGAAIGREFTYELLTAVVSLPDAALQVALDRLAEAGMVSRRGSIPWATFQFKHALVQDAAYGTLLHTTRRDLHARIVRAIQARFPDMAEAQPELLAQHCAHADLIDEAVEYWSKAGHRAIARSAMQEAAAQLRKAIELVSKLPDTPARQRRELDLTTSLGTALIAAKGYTDDETGRAYARARVLCQGLGDASRLIAAVRGQCSYLFARGEVPAVLSVAADLLAEAELRDNREMRLTAHQLLGIGVFYAGCLHEAREHLETAARLLAEAGEGVARFAHGRDALVGIPAYQAVLLLLLGEYEAARAQNGLGLAMARRQERKHRLAFMLGMTVWFHTLLDEDASPRLAELRCLAAEQGFPYWAGFVQMCEGLALCRAGDADGGIALARQGVARHDAAGAAWSVPILLVTLAAAIDASGAHDLVDEAFARTKDTGVHFFMPEYHRLKGKLLLGTGDTAGAEAHYTEALGIARQQGARHWELRAAVELARLWRDQGRWLEAREMLRPVCDAFAPEACAAGLRDARALLGELARAGQRSAGASHLLQPAQPL